MSRFSNHRSKIYQFTFNRIFKAANDALLDNGFKIIESDINKGIIKAKAPLSLKAWGENIEVQIYQLDIGIDVHISSVAHHQVIDWGKSKENVSDFFKMLDNRLERDI